MRTMSSISALSKVVAVEWTIREKGVIEGDGKASEPALVQDNKENTSPHASTLDSALIEDIVRIGYSEAWAKRLPKEYSIEVIEKAVAATLEYLETGKAKNSKAMLKKALAEEWEPKTQTEKETLPVLETEETLREKINASPFSQEIKQKQLYLLEKLGAALYKSWIEPHTWENGKLVFLTKFARDQMMATHSNLMALVGVE